jgi:hypothetical protein
MSGVSWRPRGSIDNVTLDEILTRVDAVRKLLVQPGFSAMSNMGIPSYLRAANHLIGALETYPAPDERIASLIAELKPLRDDFARRFKLDKKPKRRRG